jgi:hypothetical protein
MKNTFQYKKYFHKLPNSGIYLQPINLTEMTKIATNIFIILSSIFGIIGAFSFFVIILNKSYHFNESQIIDADLASKFGDFFGGFVGTIFSMLSVFLLIFTIFQQKKESQKTALETNFFRMIDYHNQNVNQLKIAHLDLTKKNDISHGRRAFVQFKIQVHHLLEVCRQINNEKAYKLTDRQIADIAYIVFYYGIEGSWVEFIESKFERYSPIQKEIAIEIQNRINLNPNLKIGRTNQTNLSSYFRNMYSAITMVNDSKFLTHLEKKDLMKIYTAQLSNPELYILFFHVISRFGKKWNDKKYVTNYLLLENIPNNYCDDYIPNDYFPMKYEEHEY